MTTTLLITLLAITSVVGWVHAVEAHQRACRAQANEATAAVKVEEARERAESQESLIAAYRRANDRLYLCLRDRMDEEEYAALDKGLSVYDRLVTDLMDRETWGGAL